MSVSLVKATRINYVHPDRVKAPAVPFVSNGSINYVHPGRIATGGTAYPFGCTAAQWAALDAA